MAQAKKKKYKLCCLANMMFSYPETPWRIYIADINDSGLVVARYEAYATETKKDAEEWMERHCEEWVICEA
jgi:hypothetical protein